MYPKLYLYKRIKDAKILIDRNFDSAISLDVIADRVYLSKYHFLRLFKESYGLTPNQYLQSRRIDKSKQLLETEDSITQVCFKVGFKSVQSFSNLFKRETGLTPSEYRRQVKAREE